MVNFIHLTKSKHQFFFSSLFFFSIISQILVNFLIKLLTFSELLVNFIHLTKSSHLVFFNKVCTLAFLTYFWSIFSQFFSQIFSELVVNYIHLTKSEQQGLFWQMFSLNISQF